jgi:hypothetical protein
MKTTTTNHGSKISMEVIVSEKWQCTACGGKAAPCRVEIFYANTGFKHLDATSKFRHRACLAGDHRLSPNWELVNPPTPKAKP